MQGPPVQRTDAISVSRANQSHNWLINSHSLNALQYSTTDAFSKLLSFFSY